MVGVSCGGGEGWSRERVICRQLSTPVRLFANLYAVRALRDATSTAYAGSAVNLRYFRVLSPTSIPMIQFIILTGRQYTKLIQAIKKRSIPITDVSCENMEAARRKTIMEGTTSGQTR